MQYIISVFTFAVIWAILVMSLNVVLGYAGQVSLGHAAFFGIGAYTAAILATRYGVPFLATVLAAMLVTGLCGGILGLPSLRVRHDFLVLATIGLNFIVVGTLQYVEFFGGALGIVGIPVPAILGFKLKGAVYLAFCTVAAALTAWASWAVQRTWGGLGLFALRDDEVAAASVGISHARYKISAFALSGVFAGLGGALYAPFVGNVFPERFGFIESITLVSMLVFGGVGTVRGAVAGGVVLKALPEYLRFVGEYRFALYGAILLLLIIFQPQGLLGEGSFIWESLRAAWSRLRGRTPSDETHRRVGHDRVAAETSVAGAGNPHDSRKAGPILAVHDVTVDFAGLRALDAVSLNVSAGEILGLIGPNGAGKTTLFNAITGVVSITSGRITLAGEEIQSQPPHDVARQGIARTFQVVRPFESLDVQHNVLTGAGIQVYPEPRAFAHRYNERLRWAGDLAARSGLAGLETTPSTQLPIGLLRRLEVSRALATRGQFVLLDEPAAGLPHEEVEELAVLVRGIARQGMGVILVEHNMRFAMQVCDRLVVLAAGRVLAKGEPNDVRRNPEVIEAYLGTDA